MTIDFNVAKIATKLKAHISTLQPILDMQVLKDSNYYAPMDTGNLQASAITGTYFEHPTKALTIPILQSGQMSVTAGKGKVVWNTPYAKKMYYGVGYNFSKDSNPNAQAKWFEKAKATKIGNWRKIINAHS